MNSISMSFDEHQINRTVIGGVNKIPEGALNMSVILLNSSGSHFKLQLFENLLSCNFSQIISIEHDKENFALDDLTKKYPQIKFIIPLEPATDGEMINMAMSEVSSDYVLVLRDNLYLPASFLMPNLAENLTKENIYCIVPRLTDSEKAGVHCVSTPRVEKTHFIINSSATVYDGAKTLYPFDNIAIYNRKKFIQLGGFDYSIKTPYWQNLDLAIRSWLWGEETKITTMLQFSYIGEPPSEEHTINLDYLRYYLKNELPKMKMGAAVIKKISFFVFFFHSSCGILEARKQFNAARNWVKENRYKFKMDLQSFIQGWGKSDENK